MRVLVASVVHTPLDARIHHRQVRALRAAGIEVTQIGPWSTAGGAGSAVDGVATVDVPRAVGRRRIRALRVARREIRRLGPGHDLILLHDPELVLAVAGGLSRLPPVVLDVHEDLPASLVDRPWIPGPLRPIAMRLARALERWAESHLASLLLAEEVYAGRFRSEHPVVLNLPWSPDAASPVETSDRVVYVGRLSRGRGAEELVAIGAALAQLTADAPGPRLELIGPADRDVEPLVRAAHDRGTVTWHGFVPNDAAMASIRGALAGLAPLHDLPNYRRSMPTKVVEYLANGVPAIVTPLPEAKRLVEDSGGGVVVPFGDVTETVATIRRLHGDPSLRAAMGAAGRAFVAGERSWDAAAPAFVAHLCSVAGLPTSAAPPPAAPASGLGGRDVQLDATQELGVQGDDHRGGGHQDGADGDRQDDAPR